MNQNIILIAIIALLIGGIGGYLIADRDDYGMRGDMQGMDHSMLQSTDKETNIMPMGNMMGMDHSAMMVSSEREFIEGMIPHHQEAVDTATEVLERGGSTPEIKQLAENIVVAQEKEITEMKQWYQDWYGEAHVKGDTYQPMMRDLSNLSGAELDRVFLEDMIPHHMGAIMMAQSVRPYIDHQEIADLADAIMETQSAEINLMRELLTKL